MESNLGREVLSKRGLAEVAVVDSSVTVDILAAVQLSAAVRDW